MDWAKILPILQLVWSAVSPMLKAQALGELRKLEAAEQDRPLLESLIKAAESQLGG